MVGVSRRSLTAIIAALGLGPLPRTALAQSVRPFTWASTGGSWGEALQTQYVQPFSAALPGVPDHATQLESIAAAKILSACGRAPYDVSSGSQVDYSLLDGAGCLEAFDAALVPNLADIIPQSRLGNYWASFNIAAFGLTWNTREAKQPAGFKDLWSAQYKDRVAIPAYGWYGMLWLHAVNKLFGGNEDNIDPGMTAVAELVKKNGAVICENVDHATKLMQSGDVVMMPYLNGRTANLVANGTPAKFEFVEGTLAMGNGFSIMKGTPYSELAQRFINVTLDPARQVEFSRWSKYPPSNSKARLPPELEAIRIPDGAMQRAASVDFVKVNAHRSEYQELWDKLVLA